MSSGTKARGCRVPTNATSCLRGLRRERGEGLQRRISNFEDQGFGHGRTRFEIASSLRRKSLERNIKQL